MPLEDVEGKRSKGLIVNTYKGRLGGYERSEYYDYITPGEWNKK